MNVIRSGMIRLRATNATVDMSRPTTQMDLELALGEIEARSLGQR